MTHTSTWTDLEFGVKSHCDFTSGPLLWMQYIRKALRKFAQIWHQCELGLQDELDSLKIAYTNKSKVCPTG